MKERITEKATLCGDLQADSLSFQEIIIAVEDKFGIEIPEKMMQRDLTVSQIICIIEIAKSNQYSSLIPIPA